MLSVPQPAINTELETARNFLASENGNAVTKPSKQAEIGHQHHLSSRHSSGKVAHWSPTGDGGSAQPSPAPEQTTLATPTSSRTSRPGAVEQLNPFLKFGDTCASPSGLVTTASSYSVPTSAFIKQDSFGLPHPLAKS
jgi:hypothetical protein